MKTKSGLVYGLLLVVIVILFVAGNVYLKRSDYTDIQSPPITTSSAGDSDNQNDHPALKHDKPSHSLELDVKKMPEQVVNGDNRRDANLELAAKTRTTDKYWKYFDSIDFPPETMLEVERRLVNDEYARLVLEKRSNGSDISLEKFRQESLVPIEEKLGQLLGDLLSTAQLDVLLDNVGEVRRQELVEMINHNLPTLTENNRNLVIEAFLSELNLAMAGVRQIGWAEMSDEDRLRQIQVFTDNIRVRLQGTISEDQRLVMAEFLEDYLANMETVYDQEDYQEDNKD